MGIIVGLGFVLSFGYWCTNFLVVQGAMAADSMAGARKTPLIGAMPQNVSSFSRYSPWYDRNCTGFTCLNPGLNFRLKGTGYDYPIR